MKFVRPSGQKITRTGNTAKYAGPGVRQNILFVYFVLHRKSEMQLVCQNDHGQLGIRFCFKDIYFLNMQLFPYGNSINHCILIAYTGCDASTRPFRVFIFENMAGQVFIVPITDSVKNFRIM